MCDPLCPSHASSLPCLQARNFTGVHSLQCPVTCAFECFWTLMSLSRLAEAQTHSSSVFVVRLLLLACRAAVGAIVREKELRLREGMRILGLKVSEPLPQNSKELQPPGKSI